jgi:hypothetical protein
MALADDDELDLFDESRSHAGQVIISAHIGSGMRGILPYEEGQFCGDITNEGAADDFCLGRMPFSFDVNAGYAFNDKVEAFLEIRLGIEKDFGISNLDSGPRIRRYSPGVKLYFSDVSSSKFFSTIQFIVDTTGYEQADETDYGFKNVNGLQFDFHETMGLYGYFAETIMWERFLSGEIEIGMGVQGRFP